MSIPADLRSLRTLFASSLSLGSVCLALLLAPAASAAPVAFDIPAGPAVTALQDFGRQANAEVTYPAADLSDVHTPAVKGPLEPAAALAQLLDGTDFEGRPTTPNHFVVARRRLGLGAVRGELVRSDTGAPAAEVTIGIPDTTDYTKTDRSGRFKLSHLRPGTYTLVAGGDGYGQLRMTDVHIHPDQLAELSTEKIPAGLREGETQKLSEYVVTARTDDIERMGEFVVAGQKPAPFTDANVDIPRGIDDVQPYYIFTAQTIEQSGTTNAEDFLKNYLTMDTTAQTNAQKSSVNQIGATSALNLRGLPGAQTLILVDGRRTAHLNQAGNDLQPDINGIPLAAIDRIEVLPTSASAIYGGSAVGGVINIILKKDYQGGEIKYTYDTPFNADAPLRTLAATYGFSADNGKTHVMISAQYSDGKPMLANDRTDLVERGIDGILKRDPNFFIGQSATATGNPYPGYPPFQGGTTNIVFLGLSSLTLKNGTSLGSNMTYIPSGTPPATSAGTLDAGLVANAGAFNFNLSNGNGQYGLQNEMGSVPREKALAITVHQAITPSLEIFAEGSVDSSVSISIYNPLPSNVYPIPASAPDNPFNQTVYVSIPSKINAPADVDSITRNFTIGLIAQLPAGWKSEMDYTWSQSAFHNIYTSPDNTAVKAALANGTLNPFVDTIQYPFDGYPYFGTAGVFSSSTINDLAVRTSGQVFSFPWGRPTLTLGIEHRKEGDANGTSSGFYPSTPSNDVNDGYYGLSETTDSAYAEAEIPIVTNKNAFAGLRSLEFQAAVRSEDYSVGTGTTGYYLFPNVPGESGYFGTTVNGQPYRSKAKYTATKPMAGLSYKPMDDIILRASYATAFLPPTYSQLTNNPIASTYTTNITDPKSNKTYGVYTVQNLNSNLTPQNSKAWNIGAIWEPKGELLKGLRFDFEFFKIKEFNVITSPPGGAQFIVNNASLYPSRITRDPTTGLITLVDTSSVNLYELETEGYDLSLDYRKQTSFGNFDFYALGTIQEHYKQQISLTLPFLEYVNFPSEGGPAKVKTNATLTWQFHHWTVGWTTEFFGSYKQYGAPGDVNYYQKGTVPTTYGIPGQSTYTLAQGGFTIPSQLVHSIFASYSFGKPKTGSRVEDKLASDWTIQAGIKNVFNKLPPFDAYYQPYFYSPYGDPRLRDLWVSIKKEF
jgi:outer membrane receptor protein involved in Fe transport